MKTRLRSLLTSLLFVLSLVAGFPRVSAQTPPDLYSIGAPIITGTKKDCPIFIGRLASKSPAQLAGLRAGDRLLAVDGKDVKGMGLRQVQTLIRSEQPGNVTLRVWRDGKEFEVVVPRRRSSAIIAREGVKQAGPYLVPLDTTEAEAKRMMENEQRPIAGRAFPLHYPLNTELLLWRL